MSPLAPTGVCPRCARRSWLLAKLAEPVTPAASALRLWPALALEDEELIEAFGGRRRESLREEWERWRPRPGRLAALPQGPRTVCRHHCAYPAWLADDPLGPPALFVDGDVKASCGLGAGAVVMLLSAAPSERRRSRHIARKAQCSEPSAERSPAVAPPAPGLEPQLAGVLARVRAGEDTLAKLCAGERSCEQPALALTELELLGLLRRTEDGRYAVSAEHLR